MCEVLDYTETGLWRTGALPLSPHLREVAKFTGFQKQDVGSVDSSSLQMRLHGPVEIGIRTTIFKISRGNSPFPNYTLVSANNNLKSRLGARKYSKCMKTWHQASTSGYCSRELKRNSEMGFCLVSSSSMHFIQPNFRQIDRDTNCNASLRLALPPTKKSNSTK